MKDKLQKCIDDFKVEIENISADNKTVNEDMSRLLTDLETELENIDNSPKNQTIVEKIQHSVEQFEAEHPTLTNVLTQMIDVFNGMGI